MQLHFLYDCKEISVENKKKKTNFHKRRKKKKISEFSFNH